MGTLKWLVHSPEDVNLEARKRVEELTRYDSTREETLLSPSVTTIKASSGSAVIFIIVVGLLLTATLIKLFT